ncbi:hypothetical protein QLQ12_36185 [Actinoplanes sp. NEAU-A12]|uniref:Uncharacterized protein n=1 Tax=Actinoplanes sandaracinus TaxID=3045177 RepID=A0ABT6WWG6_9ACTN|nr:hypothetical protein [Actinoplanes sandaracinus]MDI6104044.1 hypothetical protein [Actinoplanes sandaracinus]
MAEPPRKLPVQGLANVIARDNRNFAGFNGIGFDAAGEPRPADLHHAWTRGARAVYLHLR